MRLVSFGDLYLDYYFKDGKLIGIDGGKTNANIIANLTSHFNTAFLAIIGTDSRGDIAAYSLRRLGVDVQVIKQVGGNTKAFFIEDSKYTTTCPYCDREVGYKHVHIDETSIIKNIKSDDIIVVDNVKTSTINILKAITNKAFLDIGYISDIRFKSLDEIVDDLHNRFVAINMNERVYKFIKNKFNIDSLELYELIRPELLIITRGKRGSDIIYQGEFIKKELDNVSVEVDSSGAGDAFFKEFIREIVEDNFIITEKSISKAYMNASSLASYVVTLLGARAHLKPLMKIDNYHECICKDIVIK